MGRPIKLKLVQTHFECVCGLNVVDTEYFPIRWKDFGRSGIVRRIDLGTGQPFLLQKMKADVCNCHND